MKITHSINIVAPLLLLLCAVSLSVGSAKARPNTPDYTCEGVKEFVEQQGTVVMNYKVFDDKRPTVYRKFYSRNYECPYTQVHTAFEVTTKTGDCILYICRPPKEPLFK